MGTEPGANTLDCHVTIGLVPLNAAQFLVASDPQDSLTETRPIFPVRFVAGGLDAGVPLAPGASLSHKRRLHIKGGTSGASDYTDFLFTQGTPNQGTGIMNDMVSELSALNEKKVGLLAFSLEGTGTRGGPIPSELRFEKYIGSEDPATDKDPGSWKLERLEWMEPTETTEYSAYYSTPTSRFGVFLPEGDYRVVSRNRHQSTTLQAGRNLRSEDRPNLEAPITIAEGKVFLLTEALSPERSDSLSPYGSRISFAQSPYYIATRGNDFFGFDDYINGVLIRVGFIQPMRFTVLGLGGLGDPHHRRFRTITSIFDPTARIPRPASGVMAGSFHFTGGNSAFGVQLTSGLALWTAPGQYQGYGSTGPLSTLQSFQIDSRPAMGVNSAALTVFHWPLPEGWKSIDAPGPSMATTGGMLPCEQLSSALAEGVNIVARTEVDHQADGAALYGEIKADLDYMDAISQIEGLEYLAEYKRAVGDDPLIVSARTSDLGAYGTATAFFTPANPNARNGGARPSKGWALADFLAQADGKYNVVNRPRGPKGIFTQLGFDPTLPLGQSAPWWLQTGPLSQGKANGQFDALELMSAGVIAEPGIAAWWSEFKAARADWFALLSQQPHDSFTKAVGFSSGKYSQDTPVGLVRTYLNIHDAEVAQSELGPVLAALQAGSAVVSSGPLLDVSVAGVGPGGLAAISGSPATVALDVVMLATDWMPVDELRVIVNGQVVATIYDPKAVFEQSDEDFRYFAGTITVPVPSGKDAWLVVEAGAPLNTYGPYRPGAPWHAQMKGIYPVAITNPIFLGLQGGGYAPPGL
jgi:hypothetical protein